MLSGERSRPLDERGGPGGGVDDAVAVVQIGIGCREIGARVGAAGLLAGER